jgi:hypothetical protein
MRRARGLTVVELMLAAMVMALVVGLTYTLYVNGAARSERTAESADALKSVLIAAEHLRSDLSRAVVEEPENDLAVGEDGRSFVLRLTRAVDGDPWTLLRDPVAYYLEKLPGTTMHRLVREEAGRAPERVLGSLLADMTARILWPDERNPLGVYLEVTLVGAGSPAATERHRSTVLIPLHALQIPETYALPEVEP